MVRSLTSVLSAPAVVVGAAIVSAVAAWAWLAGPAAMHPHAGPLTATTAGAAVVMWQAMMVAMMAPTVAPWLGLYARLAGDGPRSRAVTSALAFGTGYFSIWLLYSVGAATLQLIVASLGLLGRGGVPPALAGGVLVAAGAFQFAPLKRACLTHCRNPLSYLLARWRGGPPGAFRLGLAHGAYCVGCCWLLMLTGFAVGLMNLAWMAVVTGMLAAEQVAPGGVWLARFFGAALIVWGAAICWPA